MTGVPPRRSVVGLFALRPTGVACAILCVGLAVLCSHLPAQSPADQPALPASPDATPSISTDPNAPQLPVYPSSNDAASSLLPSSSPLPPRPSVPTLSLLPPDSTPPPVVPPAPLPVPEQTGSPLSPTASGTVLTNGAPGSTPSTGVLGGASATTNNIGVVRRFQYAFRLSTSVTYDDNIFLISDAPAVKTPTTTALLDNTPRRKFSRSDVLVSLDPSVSLGYGDFLGRSTNYVEFDYNVNVLLFTRNTDQDTVQHFVNLQGAYHFAQVTLSLSQGVQILNSAELGSASSGSQLGSSATGTSATQINLDTSQRTSLNIFNTRLGANYAFSDKTSMDVDGSLSIYDYETLIGSDTISADAYFNYSPTGKITLGLGVTGGYIIQDAPSPHEFYEQANLRLTYVATGKLTFAGSLGLESRESDNDGGTTVNPIFDLSVSYLPFDSTSLSLSASRRVDTSAVLAGTDFDSTGFSFSLSQRFFQRVNAGLSLGYTHSNYVSSGSSASVNRSEDYYFVQPTLDYSIREHLSASIFYVHRQSRSSLSGNGFSDNQVGARLSLSF